MRNNFLIHLHDARDVHNEADRRWIENVYPFYLHDLSEFGESIYHLNEEGIWQPDYLPVWFSAAGARPLVLRAGDQRIGFAFVGQDPFSYRSFDVDQRLSEPSSSAPAAGVGWAGPRRSPYCRRFPASGSCSP